MPYLFCKSHGPEREATTASRQEEIRQEGETTLVVEGRLISGPWLCDSCNATLAIGDTAWLLSFFPAHFRDDLDDYAFAYERGYFAMTKSDRAACYGVAWPDDSLIRRRKPRHAQRPRRVLCALDLFREK